VYEAASITNTTTAATLSIFFMFIFASSVFKNSLRQKALGVVEIQCSLFCVKLTPAAYVTVTALTGFCGIKFARSLRTDE
jgi:hypothetical protein